MLRLLLVLLFLPSVAFGASADKTINSLTTETSIASDDYIPFWDTSAAKTRKMPMSSVFAAGTGVSVISGNYPLSGTSVSWANAIYAVSGASFYSSSGSGTTINFHGPFDAGLFAVFNSAKNATGVTPVFHDTSTVVYPEWMGAKNDATTDCSWPFQVALNAGKIVKFGLPGVYNMGTSGVTTDAARDISGQGRLTQLYWPATYTGKGIYVGASNTKIHDLTLYKVRPASCPTSAIGIYLAGNETVLDGVEVIDGGAGVSRGWGYPVYVATGYWSQRIDKSTMTGEYAGIYTDRANYVSLNQSVFSATYRLGYGAGVFLSGGGGHSITDCDIEGDSYSNIHIDQSNNASGGNATTSISGNYIEGGVIAGIYLHGYVDAERQIRGIDISGNFISGASIQAYGILAQYVEGLSVTGNIISHHTTNSIFIDANSSDVSMSGNYIKSSYPGWSDVSVTAGARGSFKSAAGTDHRDNMTLGIGGTTVYMMTAAGVTVGAVWSSNGILYLTAPSGVTGMAINNSGVSVFDVTGVTNITKR